MVTHLPPTSEIGGSNPGPYVGKLVLLTNAWPFTVQNLEQLYILVSLAHKTTRRDMTCKLLKVMFNLEINE